MSAFDKRLTEDEQKNVLSVMRRVIDAYELQPDLVEVFESMTRDQKLFVGMLVQMTNQIAVEAHQEVERANRRLKTEPQ